MSLDSLESLLIQELKDLYSAEKQLTKALPKMAKAAASSDLKKLFETHLTETEGQIERLEKVFETLGASPRGHKCKAMEGLIEEGAEIIEKDGDPAVKDAALIAAGNRVEHYEIAGYGTVAAFAQLLGKDDVAEILRETLEEERSADEKLTKVAMEKINIQAESNA
jgi:ferritin-like metal-binding protein YciE